MNDPHEDLVEAVAVSGHITHRAARRVIALIAERTKEATPETCEEIEHTSRMGGIWAPKTIWTAMHRASCLWPKEKP